ncbi:hypothetical protein HPB47_010421, partial [Ixodes persulcatus]
ARHFKDCLKAWCYRTSRDDYAAERKLRVCMKEATQVTEFLWERLRASYPKKQEVPRDVNGNVVFLGGASATPEVMKILNKGPKFATESAVKPSEMLALTMALHLVNPGSAPGPFATIEPERRHACCSHHKLGALDSELEDGHEGAASQQPRPRTWLVKRHHRTVSGWPRAPSKLGHTPMTSKNKALFRPKQGSTLETLANQGRAPPPSSDAANAAIMLQRQEWTLAFLPAHSGMRGNEEAYRLPASARRRLSYLQRGCVLGHTTPVVGLLALPFDRFAASIISSAMIGNVRRLRRSSRVGRLSELYGCGNSGPLTMGSVSGFGSGFESNYSLLKTLSEASFESRFG